MSISTNIQEIRKHIPENIKLVCVSKFHPAETILEAYSAGERIFGESRAQELIAKQPQLPDDIQWHFIGHLQSNKIKMLVPFVSLIHGVDSLKLLQEIDKQAEKAGRKINCLLQVYIAEEETKFGFYPEELLDLFQNKAIQNLQSVQISGLMGMATFTENAAQVRKEFHSLKSLFNKIKSEYYFENDNFCEISMGMSQDYVIAIEEGSTMIRIGTSIFGEREY